MPLILFLPLFVAAAAFAGVALWTHNMRIEAMVIGVLGLATVAAMVGL